MVLLKIGKDQLDCEITNYYYYYVAFHLQQ